MVVFQQFGCWHSVFWRVCSKNLDVGILYFGGCVPTIWMLALCTLAVCSNNLDVGTLYFGSCVPTIWMLALCILAVVFQQFGCWHSVFWWLCSKSLVEPPCLGHFPEEVDVPSSEELEPFDQTTRGTHQENAIFRDFEAHQTAHCKVCPVPVCALLQT